MSHPLPPVVAQDPLLRTFHERHPDVDLVILPPAVPAPTSESAEVREQAAVAVSAVGGVLDDVFAALGLTPSLRVEHWTSSSRGGSRSRVGRAGALGLDDGTAPEALERVGNALLALGWDARPYADGSRRLRGVLGDLVCGDLVCEAEATDTSVIVEVRSTPLPISDATADALESAR